MMLARIATVTNHPPRNQDLNAHQERRYTHNWEHHQTDLVSFLPCYEASP